MLPKFRLISDCHFECYNEILIYNRLASMGIDRECVLVIAGDFIELRLGANAAHLIRQLSAEYKAIVYVPGNHEFWGSRIDKAKQLFDTKLNPDNLPNVHFLARDSVVIDGVRYIGATLWTDMDRHCPLVYDHLWDHMRDFKKITYKTGTLYQLFRPMHWLQEHVRDLEYIKSAVAESAEPVVVVTHHAPSAKSLDPAFASDVYGNHGYHTNLDDYIEATPNIRYWCHGHIHYANMYRIGCTDVVCNPYGYPSEDVEYFDRVFHTID